MKKHFFSIKPKVNKVIREYDKNVTNLFNDFIDHDFLVKIYKRILKDKEFKWLISAKSFPDIYKASPSKVMYEYDVLITVTAVFWYHSIYFGSDKEKVKELYTNEKYIKVLLDRVYDQIYLRPLLKPKEDTSIYAHLPICAAMHCLINFLYAKLLTYIENNTDYQNNPNIDFRVASFRQMFLTIQSALNSMENQDYSGAYASLRSLIEDYFIYLVLHDNTKAIKEYIRFTDWRKYYEINEELPQDYTKTLLSGCDPLGYLDYGWLRFFDHDPQNSYHFKDLVRHARSIDKEEGKEWIKTYRLFSKNSHGEILDFNKPEIEIPDISSYLSDLVLRISKLYLEAFNESPMYVNVDLIDFLQLRRDGLYKILGNSDFFKTSNS